MQDSKTVTVGLDTSGSMLLVSVRASGRQVVRRKTGIKQERLLFPVLQAALQAAGTTLQEVKRICIVRGPGRFTGIRIALTFASMMKFLNRAEIYGATVFELIRRQAENTAAFARFKRQNSAGVLGVILHAFREEYFLQIFDERNVGPLWLSREELLERLASYPAPIMLAGTDKNGASLAELTQGRYLLANIRDGRVRPETLLALSQEEKFKTDALEPLYLKPARFELIIPK